MDCAQGFELDGGSLDEKAVAMVGKLSLENHRKTIGSMGKP